MITNKTPPPHPQPTLLLPPTPRLHPSPLRWTHHRPLLLKRLPPPARQLPPHRHHTFAYYVIVVDGLRPHHSICSARSYILYSTFITTQCICISSNTKVSRQVGRNVNDEYLDNLARTVSEAPFLAGCDSNLIPTGSSEKICDPYVSL